MTENKTTKVSETQEEKYEEGDNFLEVMFQLKVEKRVFKNDSKIKMIVESVLDVFPNAKNIKAIPCEVRKHSAYLEISKDDCSYSLFNVKHQGDIVEETK